MPTTRFRASVQYGDWKGTSAADRAAKADADDWLEKNGHKQPGEFLLGVTMYAGESHGVHKDPVHVEFLLVTSGDHDTVKAMLDANPGPIMVKKVRAQMTLIEFFGLFKRFSVTLSSHGMLGEREYTYVGN